MGSVNPALLQGLAVSVGLDSLPADVKQTVSHPDPFHIS